MSDSIQRFLLEATPVRGEIAHLDATWRAVLERREYPQPLQTLLGEMMAAAALLSATLKFEGSLIMQMQGSGPVQLLVVEATSEHTLRATAKWEGELPGGSVTDMLGNGRFVISIVAADGKQSYQGIVAIEGSTIAQVLEHYMEKSEQIETRLWLACDPGKAAGMLLQKLPNAPGQDADAPGRALGPHVGPVDVALVGQTHDLPVLVAQVGELEEGEGEGPGAEPQVQSHPVASEVPVQSAALAGPTLVYRIEIVLPAVRDQAVYDSIFKSAREHLLK